MPRRRSLDPEGSDESVIPAALLPDRSLPLEERRRRSRALDAWFTARGVTDRVKRRNIEIASRKLHPDPALLELDRAGAVYEDPRTYHLRELEGIPLPDGIAVTTREPRTATGELRPTFDHRRDL